MADAKATDAPVAEPTFEDAAKAVAGVVALVKTKPWHESLTVQGALVGGAGAGIVAYGPAVLAACGLDHGAATQLAEGASGVLASIGALMSLIGRLRLGGLS